MYPQGNMYPRGYNYPWGYMYPQKESIGGLLQVWKVPISNVYSKKSRFFWLFNSSPICHLKNTILFIKNSVFEYSAPSKLRFCIFKTSISRKHAYRVLHSRFPPFGFVLKPFWSVYLFLNMIMADSCLICIPGGTCIPGETCIPKGIHVSPRGYMYPGERKAWGIMTSLESSDLQRIFKKICFFWLFNSLQICHVKHMILFIKKSVFEYSAPSELGFCIFKTSISRNDAYRVLHSRFPPSGLY